jgi:mono/diheme cytochrome c family protein
MKGMILTLVALFGLTLPALADDAPYIEAGHRLAEGNCAQCHNIEPGGAFKLYPPSFAAIAAYMDADMIRMKIMYPDHALLMPQFHTFMFAENLDNIVGYIQSLEQ